MPTLVIEAADANSPHDVRGIRQRRLELAPFYADIPTGHPWLHEMKAVEEIRAGMLRSTSFRDEWADPKIVKV
jgi:hypothetical protein